MGKVNFLVQGSAVKPYKVTFMKDGNNLTALCTCPAGENGLYCKHRFGILDGNKKNIVSENTNDVETVRAWLQGTDVEEALSEVAKAEKLAEAAKKELTAAKKKLARVMRD